MNFCEITLTPTEQSLLGVTAHSPKTVIAIVKTTYVGVAHNYPLLVETNTNTLLLDVVGSYVPVKSVAEAEDIVNQAEKAFAIKVVDETTSLRDELAHCDNNDQCEGCGSMLVATSYCANCDGC